MYRLIAVVAVLALLGGCSPSHGTPDRPVRSRSVAGLGIEGSFGSAPILRFPDGRAPVSHRRAVVETGRGATVRTGDLLAIDYHGQFWAGEVFDDTFAKPHPSTFPVTEGSFFPRFSESVVGARVGDRLVVVVPPPPEAIKQAKTFVFVIDVIAAYRLSTPPTHGADPTGVKAPISVSGGPRQPPTVAIPEGLPEPTHPVTTVLARGRGAPVREGPVVLTITMVDWTGRLTMSSWKDGAPTSARIEQHSSSPMLDAIRGIPVGSRVLIQLPPQNRADKQDPAQAVVIDVIDQPRRGRR